MLSEDHQNTQGNVQKRKKRQTNKIEIKHTNNTKQHTSKQQ